MTRRTPDKYDWNSLSFDETLMRKNFSSQPSKNVRFVVVHHAVVRDTNPGNDEGLDAIYNIWQTRPSSAQYGVEGKFVRQYVWDKDYAWACGNYEGNRDGIHIEHVNSTLDQPGTVNDYLVSDETWKNGARLVAQIHKKYKMGRPVKNVTVRKHSSFKSTACPGPYLGDRIWDEYVAGAQRVYDEITSGEPTPPPVKKPSRGRRVDGAIKLLRQAKGKGERAQLIKDALTALTKIKSS